MSYTILIVEDNRNNCTLLGDILSFHGYEIAVASDGSEGVALARTLMPDLILMDISLQGGMNGLELTKLLKSDDKYAKIPIITVTGHASNGDRDRILYAGCDDYLAKPFDTNVLLEKIKINTRH